MIMHWQSKALIQKALGFVPFGDIIHYKLQRLIGGLRNPEKECIKKVDDWRIMLSHFQNEGIAVENASLVEIGSGWYPTFPVCLYLLGAETVFTFDLNRHMKVELTQICINVLGENLSVIQSFISNPDSVTKRYTLLSKRFAETGNIETATDGVIQYNAPADAAKTGLSDTTVDIVYSNSVLEHIPGSVIVDIMKEAWRILKPKGVMFHSVNCGDHYSYVDSSISQLNYLQYSDSEWGKWNNDFLYQNRMRHGEFVELAKKTGFNIMLNTAKATDIQLKLLAALPTIAEKFSSLEPEELCITSVDFLCNKL